MQSLPVRPTAVFPKSSALPGGSIDLQQLDQLNISTRTDNMSKGAAAPRHEGEKQKIVSIEKFDTTFGTNNDTV